MQEWGFAQTSPDDQLAKLHFFSMKTRQALGEIEFRITVYEYVTPKDPSLTFFAVADKQTNQKTVPYTPSGWGRNILDALSDCMKAVRRFPYEGPEIE
jgi:hypothetical protein